MTHGKIRFIMQKYYGLIVLTYIQKLLLTEIQDDKVWNFILAFSYNFEKIKHIPTKFGILGSFKPKNRFVLLNSDVECWQPCVP